MPRPKDSDLLKRDVQKIRAAMKWRQNEKLDDLWHDMVDLYRGKHYKTNVKEDRMLVNLAFATKNVIAPSVAINNPKFKVDAQKPDSMDQAVIAEQVLNYIWRTHAYKDEFRLSVDDFLVIGHGWLKVGYKATKPPVVTYPDDSSDIDGDDCGVDDRDETVQGNVESEVRSFTDDDRPFVERLSPFDVFCDADAKHPKYMSWIAQRVRRNVNDVRVDSRYDPKQRSKINAKLAVARIDDQNHPTDGSPRDPSSAYVDVWEFYDLRKNTVSTFCIDMEEGFLIRPQPIPYSFGHPFVMLRNYEVTDYFYPLGEMEMIEELQHELNATRTQMMNHRKRWQRKYLYDKDAFDDDGIKALLDDKDNVLVPVDYTHPQTDPVHILQPMPQLGINPDLYNQSDVIENDIDRVSGVSDYMRGAQADIRRTATEAAMIQDAQNARAADKLANIEATLSLLGGRVVQLLQQYMDGEHVVRIVGGADPHWLQFDADYIAGDFDFTVEGGSTQPRNESFRRQSAMQLMETMMPFIQLGVVNPMELARHVLQNGFDIKDVDSLILAPQVDPATGQPVQPGAGQQPGMPQQGAPQAGAPAPQGAPPQGGQAPPESPIPGIPPELVNQLMGQSGVTAH